MGKLLKMLAFWSVAIAASLCCLAAAEARDFRAADTQTADYPTVQAVEYMSRIVADRTQGRYRIVVFHSRQLGEERETIEAVYEPFLVQSGYLERTPRGRMATQLCWDYFGRERPTGTRQGRLL